VTPADGMGRDHAAGAEGPSLARAYVSVGLSLGLENGPRGRTLGVGEEPAGLVYRWPPVSTPLERDLSVAYTAITGRRVFRGPHRLLILAARLHGPDTIPLLGELYREGGVDDLLRRLIAHPPRLDPHPDYIVAPAVPPQAEPQGPAAPSPAAPSRMASESPADRASRGVRPRPIEANHRTSSGLTPIAAIVRRPAEDRLTPGLSAESGPLPTPDQDDRLPASAGDLEPRQAHGSETSPAEPGEPARSGPPSSHYPLHEPIWAERPDGTWRCATCHP